jgi:hypothetical protein
LREISLARGLGLRARLVCVAGGGRTPWCMGGGGWGLCCRRGRLAAGFGDRAGIKGLYIRRCSVRPQLGTASLDSPHIHAPACT